MNHIWRDNAALCIAQYLVPYDEQPAPYTRTHSNIKREAQRLWQTYAHKPGPNADYDLLLRSALYYIWNPYTPGD